MKRQVLTSGVGVLASSALIVAVALAGGNDSGETLTDQLRAQAKAATGEPGGTVPLCPSEAVVAALKEAKIPFGPCLPVAADASPAQKQAMLANAPPVALPVGPEPAGQCGAIDSMTADGEISVDLGCGTEIVNEEYFESGGRTCHRVTLASKRDPAQEPTTKTACTKDAK